MHRRTHSRASSSLAKISVQYDAQDLESDKGVENVYRKLRKAARRVCGIDGGFLNLSEKTLAQKCVDDTLASAVRKIDRPMLTTLHDSLPAREVGSAVDQDVRALLFPGALVASRRCASRSAGVDGWVVHPFAQQLAAVDEVDREPRAFVFVREVPPQLILAAQSADALERAGDEPPRTEVAVVVGAVLDVDLESRAELARVFVERRLEPELAAGGSRATSPA